MFLGSGELINLLSSPLSKINSQWEVKLFGITVDDNLLFNKYINNLHAEFGVLLVSIFQHSD